MTYLLTTLLSLFITLIGIYIEYSKIEKSCYEVVYDESMSIPEIIITFLKLGLVISIPVFNIIFSIVIFVSGVTSSKKNNFHQSSLVKKNINTSSIENDVVCIKNEKNRNIKDNPTIKEMTRKEVIEQLYKEKRFYQHHEIQSSESISKVKIKLDSKS